jgi:hypothetical protein
MTLHEKTESVSVYHWLFVVPSQRAAWRLSARAIND